MNKFLCLSVVVVCASAVPALGRQDAKGGPKAVYRTEPVNRAALAKAPVQQKFVWVEDKGFVRPIAVVPGLSDGAMTEILQGKLAEGTAVVVGVKDAP